MAYLISNKKFLDDELSVPDVSKYETAFTRSIVELIVRWKSDQHVFSFHTSGSTGTPKPIQFTREQLKASALLTIDALGLLPNQTSMVCLDPRFIAGQMMVIRSLENSMNIIAIDPTADPLENISSDQKIHFAAFVPYQLEAILNSTSSGEKLSRIDKIIIGGAPVNRNSMERLQSLKCQVFATYGMTETITHIALQRLNGPAKKEYFQSLTGVKLSLDERNCLVIEAPHLPARVTTNDIVELLDTNKFIWLGRWDNVINSGGIKVIPEKVEAEIKLVLENLNLSNRFFLGGLPDQKLGSKVALFIEGEENANKSLIITQLVARLNKYEIPKEIYFIPRFIETSTQKINRRETIKSRLQ